MWPVTDKSLAIGVASFNVCGLPSQLPSVAERAAYFCRAIEESDIGVVNLQEVWTRRTLEVIRTHLPSFPFLAWRRGAAGQPAGGLVTFSRSPVGTVSYTSFRGARPTAGSIGFRMKLAVNSLLQGMLTAEVVGLGAIVANTHLTANKDGDWSADNRYHSFQRTQVEMLHTALRQARGTGSPLLILTGDFNIASDGSLYPLIIDSGTWRDPFATTDPATYHVAFLPPGSSAHRIDYLLVSGDPATFPVTDNELLFTEPLTLPGTRPMYLSDHVALTARIGLPPRR